jgi:hypothetical protein
MISGTASAATWTITPGGPFTATAGTTLLEIQESGIQLSCVSASATGTLKSGTNLTNPLAQIPGTQFTDCQGPFGLTFEVIHVGTWELNGVTYNAGTGVSTGTLDNIEADIVGPGCNATVTGSVPVTFTNSSDVLSVLPDFTLTVSFVDPANDCLGLINQGEHANFDGDFVLSPGQTVTSP